MTAITGNIRRILKAGQLILLVIPYEETLDVEPLPQRKVIEKVSADDETEISTDEPNVLVLDYAKFRINDGEFSEKKRNTAYRPLSACGIRT